MKKMSKAPSMFVQYIQQRIKNNKNFLCAITGQTGSGKSWSALSLAPQIDPNFSIENVCFTATEFMHLVNGKSKKLQTGAVILWDEMQVTMSNLEFQSIQAKLINYVLQTFRHRNFVLIVTTPHFNFLNAGARRLFHCRTETISINRRLARCTLKPLMLQTNQNDGKVYQKYLRVKVKGRVKPLKRLRVLSPPKDLIVQYEAKKKAFTDKLNADISRDLEKLEGKKAESKTIDNLCKAKCLRAWSSPRRIEQTSKPTPHKGRLPVGGNPPVMLKRTS